MKQIRKKRQDLLLVRVPVFDPPEQSRLLSGFAQAKQINDLVAENISGPGTAHSSMTV